MSIVTCKVLGNMGRLGNQLFQMAATIGYALDNGKEFVFPRWNYGQFMVIPTSSEEITCTEIAEENLRYNHLTGIDGNVNLQGHFLSTLYFQHHKKWILKYFSLEKCWHRYIDKKYGHILSKNTCAIHVRRGDYLQPEQLADQGCMGVDYYKKALSYLPPAIIADVTLVVCSDDIEWCKANFKDGNIVFIEGEPDIIDMFIMSKCKHNIICNSTFGWWSAYLNKNEKKTVITPRQWFVNTQGWDDLYEPDWIVI